MASKFFKKLTKSKVKYVTDESIPPHVVETIMDPAAVEELSSAPPENELYGDLLERAGKVATASAAVNASLLIAALAHSSDKEGDAETIQKLLYKMGVSGKPDKSLKEIMDELNELYNLSKEQKKELNRILGGSGGEEDEACSSTDAREEVPEISNPFSETTN